MTDAGLTLDRAWREMGAKTKPLGALGYLEHVAVRLALLQGTLKPTVEAARICVFGADHGVADEGVSAYPRAVTGEMMRNFDRGGAAINVIASSLSIDVEVIDVGVDADLSALTSVRHERVRAGSRNMAEEPAMSDEEFAAALRVGARSAQRAHSDGIALLGLGEMGIANTTAAAAVAAALAGVGADATVGRGTGVTDDVLLHKRQVVDAAIARHRVHIDRSASEALRCVGGLELAAIAGAATEAARLRLAVVVDGFISSAATLAALAMAREESEANARLLASALFFSHRSAEAGHALVLEQCSHVANCDSRPLLDLGLRLGEGTGAALAVPLLRAAAAVIGRMATFESAEISTGNRSEHRA